MKSKRSYKKSDYNGKKKTVKIMVFGTFDVLHKGHRHFFKQARKLAKNPFLIVSVARDINVIKIKGQKPRNNEMSRLKAVRKDPLVDKAVLGEIKNYLGHIVKAKPQVIALGHDQKDYTQNLQQKLKSRGLSVVVRRLKPYKRHLYRSSLAKAVNLRQR